MVTICTASLTFNNSTFCPHTVFMCFVWIWEQTAIISLYSINWLVFITQTASVYCAVRTGCLRNIEGNFRAMVHAVSRQPLTAEVWVRFQCSSSGGQSDTRSGFPPSTSIFLSQYHSANAPHSSSSTCCSYQKDKLAKPGKLPKSDALSGRIGQQSKNCILCLWIRAS